MSQRQAMPICAAFIDDMRKAFGVDEINRQQQRGMAGEPVFWASENGRTLGTKAPDGYAVPPVLPLALLPPRGRR